MPQLSVVIITLNEERNIRSCLDSVRSVADEIIVVDSGSTDGTLGICEEMGITAVQQSWLGYAAQKNFANALASNDWILSLDADEALSEDLKNSVLEWKRGPATPAAFARLTNYCGKFVRHGGWYPDTKIRIFNRLNTSWSGTLHETLTGLSLSDCHVLKGDCIHYSFHTLSDHIRQIDRFSTIGAKALYDKGKRGTLLKILYKPAGRFLRNYVIHAGFLDGLTGLIIAINSAHAVFLKYLRLYYLHKDKVV